MKITKYEHACLVVEDQGKKLIIDPGVYSQSYVDFANVEAVIITHVHADHLDLAKLTAIHEQNPNAVFFGTQEVADQVKDSLAVTVIQHGDEKTIDGFRLKFYGKDHAFLYSEAPIFQNTGVMVNDTLYYPGDAFTVPDVDVHTLALPAGSPWAKIAEEIDFLQAVKPRQAFPTHNAHLSDIGQQGRDNWLAPAAQKQGTTYTVLKPGESFSV